MTEQSQTAAARAKKHMEAAKITFADENARIAWEVGRAIDQIANEFTPEVVNRGMQEISFSQDAEARGIYAIFIAGTVVGTGRRGFFVVPERTLRILDQLNIPYIES